MKEMPKHKTKTPWPTKKVMEQIYRKNLWGFNGNQFYSGEGSHKEKYVTPYVKVIHDFFKAKGKSLSVCDLGCGDFNVGKQLIDYCSAYYAIDIVEELIEYNKAKFRNENLEFFCLDIAKDNLPKADCVLLRQVLQHLSNKEISAILEKLHSYKYVIITEHIPSTSFKSNVDIISGQGIRLKKKSGVVISEPPFNFISKNKKEILSIPLENKDEKIITTLYEN